MIRLEAERTHRPVARIAVYVEHPAQRGEDSVIRCVIAIRTRLPERRHREQDQRRVNVAQRVPSEADFAHPPRLEAFDHDIRRAREPEHDFRAARIRKVESK
jgi:hypothetical protein